MYESRQCSLNDAFFLTITFDEEKSNQEDRQRIVLKLFSNNTKDQCLATKMFTWPETKLPLEVKYIAEDNIVQLIGVDNMAKIAINMDDMLLARLISMRQPVQPCPFYTSVGKDRQLLPTDAITVAIINIVNAEDVEHWWGELIKLLTESATINISEQLRRSLLAPWRQEVLFDCVAAHINANDSTKKVLSILLKERVFTAENVCERIVKLAEHENWLDIAIDLVRYALSIDERVYAVCLKIAIDKIESGGVELLNNLLNHKVTRDILTEQLSVALSAQEAAILIDHLITLLDAQQIDNNNIYSNIIELLMILVDGCAYKMIWDNKCHDSVRKAASCIYEQVQLVDAFSSFGYHMSNDASRIASTETNIQYCDYVVESIPYQCREL